MKRHTFVLPISNTNILKGNDLQKSQKLNGRFMGRAQHIGDT